MVRNILVGLLAVILLTACSDIVEKPSGLKYKDLTVGDGAQAVDGMTVLCHYTLWFADGSGMIKKEQVESSKDSGEPLQCRIGHGLIQGWSEGMLGMREGGMRRVFVPWQLGYGENGNTALGVPSKQNLIFEIEFLRKVQPGEM